MKAKIEASEASNRAFARANGPRERWPLIVLWIVGLLSPLVALHGDATPAWLPILGAVGVVALAILVLRLALEGFAGCERRIGLKIIQRESEHPLLRRGLWLSLLVTAASLAAFLLVRSPVDPWPMVRLVLLGCVSLSTFLGLMLVIAQRFTVFGTTSIVGVVLGVAALLVIESVATGFQHEFERRVRGVYAHINVTQADGIARHHRLEAWLRTIDGVAGASPFVYYYMALAPHGPRDVGESAVVLVKGIAPESADQVIDLVDHLARGSGTAVPLAALRSEFQPTEPDISDLEALPPVLEEPSPKDPAAPAHFAPRTAQANDDWVDPPRPGQTLESGRLDPSLLPTMFIGNALARELGIQVGDVVRMVDTGAGTEQSQRPDMRYFRVAGIFQAGFHEYDSRLIYVHIRELQRVKYGGKDMVSGIDLRLKDPDQSPEIGAVIRRALGPKYSILEWQKLNESLFSSIRTQTSLLTIVLSLVICVASFNVLSLLWTMVVRRTTDVAILMSMGATSSQVARMFQVTGMTIGLAGSVAGVLFGLMLCWLIQQYGYSLDPEVYYIEELPVEVSPVQVAGVFALSLLFCYMATIPPALRASQLRPVEGLRYE